MIDLDALEAGLPRLPAHPRVISPGSHACPLTLLHKLDQIVDSWRFFCVNAPNGIPTEGVDLETVFVGPGMRNQPRLHYYPARLSLAPRLFRTTLRPDVVVLHTSTPRNGMVSIGIEVQVLPAALEAVRENGGVVIAQVNPQMPFIHGDGLVPVDEIDLGVEIDTPLLSQAASGSSDAAQLIGQQVASLVPDGASIQSGIGAMPDAVLSHLKDRHGLRIWTELMTEGAMMLDRAGALDPDQPIVSSFMVGSQEFYDWASNNPRIQLLRTETTNEPSVIAAIPQMVSINTVLQVDLFAQLNASRIGTRIYSGIGGSTDFLIGSIHSPGGKAIIALNSWHPKADVSTIVAHIDAPISAVQPSYVVTENGVAEIFGHDQDDQARQLIENAAHPSARDQLRGAASAMGLSV